MTRALPITKLVPGTALITWGAARGGSSPKSSPVCPRVVSRNGSFDETAKKVTAAVKAPLITLAETKRVLGYEWSSLSLGKRIAIAILSPVIAVIAMIASPILYANRNTISNNLKTKQQEMHDRKVESYLAAAVCYINHDETIPGVRGSKAETQQFNDTILQDENVVQVLSQFTRDEQREILKAAFSKTPGSLLANSPVEKLMTEAERKILANTQANITMDETTPLDMESLATPSRMRSLKIYEEIETILSKKSPTEAKEEISRILNNIENESGNQRGLFTDPILKYARSQINDLTDASKETFLKDLKDRLHQEYKAQAMKQVFKDADRLNIRVDGHKLTVLSREHIEDDNIDANREADRLEGIVRSQVEELSKHYSNNPTEQCLFIETLSQGVLSDAQGAATLHEMSLEMVLRPIHGNHEKRHSVTVEYSTVLNTLTAKETCTRVLSDKNVVTVKMIVLDLEKKTKRTSMSFEIQPQASA